MGRAPNFFMSSGAVMIGLGLVALIGLSAGRGWLTRLAGALSIVAFALFAIATFRAPGAQAIDIGAWLCLAGAVVVVLAGWFDGTSTTVTSPTATTNP